ncbi:MAG: hypothetical protein GY938_05015 [Ketobacter sp.]|nr:hypothetical protein [Ketobacter sp.]
MEKNKSNSGVSTTSGKRGMKVKNSFGRDNSDVSGSASQERGGKAGGGKSNLSHSLSGTKANQSAD